MPSFTTSRRRVIAALALTSALLITLDLQGNSAVGSARRGFGAVFSPFEDAARVVSRPIENAWRGVRDYPDVAKENRELEQQLAEQEATYLLWLAERQDYAEAMAATDLDAEYGTPIPARVIGDSPSNFEQTITIDKGTNDGIEVGGMVVVGQTLVGKITQASSDRAIVMLITDPRFAVAVKVENVAEETAAEGETPEGEVPEGETPEGEATPDTSLAPEGEDPAATTTLPPETTLPPDGSGSTTLPPEQLPDDPLAPLPTVPVTAPDPSAQPARQTGSLEGRGPDRNPYVVRVDSSARFGRIEIHAVVRTSGGTNGTSLAPQGLLVGTVLRTIELAGSGGDALEIRPAVAVASLDFVAVLPRPPGG